MLPTDLKLLSGLRLDVANGPVVFDLHTLSLHQANGDLIWLWDDDCTAFKNMVGVFCLKDINGTSLLCVDGDPRFDLDMPVTLLNTVLSDAFLRITFTPKSLLQELPYVIAKLMHYPSLFSGDIDSESHSEASCAASLTNISFNIPKFVKRHELVNSLLPQAIQCKDQLLEQQQRQLHQMRDELLRAEAQLELLKDLWLAHE
jgi:hypothetical protein